MLRVTGEAMEVPYLLLGMLVSVAPPEAWITQASLSSEEICHSSARSEGATGELGSAARQKQRSSMM